MTLFDGWVPQARLVRGHASRCGRGRWLGGPLNTLRLRVTDPDVWGILYACPCGVKVAWRLREGQRPWPLLDGFVVDLLAGRYVEELRLTRYERDATVDGV